MIFATVSLLTWNVFSTLALSRMADSIADAREKHARALSTIFEYQTRYESVYEKVYPQQLPAIPEHPAQTPDRHLMQN